MVADLIQSCLTLVHTERPTATGLLICKGKWLAAVPSMRTALICACLQRLSRCYQIAWGLQGLCKTRWRWLLGITQNNGFSLCQCRDICAGKSGFAAAI